MRMRQEALTDGLTGLLNRKAFDEQMAAEVTVANHHGVSLCLVLIDIDHFKQVNDTFGHVSGRCSALPRVPPTGQLRGCAVPISESARWPEVGIAVGELVEKRRIDQAQAK
jgi:Diguanylate cyclase, GGDEF domain